MDKLDPSSKKQLSLLLAKSVGVGGAGGGTIKVPKPIVSSVPLAQIRKAVLKDHSEAASALVKSDGESSGSTSLPKTPEKLVEKSSSLQSPLKSPTKSPLKSSKSNYELGKMTMTPQQHSLLPSSSSPLKSAKSATDLVKETEEAEVPMDQISIRPSSPVKAAINLFNQLSSASASQSSPMKIDTNKNIPLESTDDVYMDTHSGDNLTLMDGVVYDSGSNMSSTEDSDSEVILNVKNVVKTVDDLTSELPRKIELGTPSTPLTKAKRPFEWSPTPSPSKTSSNASLPHSISSPSIPSRIKSLGLASGTPLRAMYRNTSVAEMRPINILSHHQSTKSSSLLNDLIEEFCNTTDIECFKKILELTAKRSGDFDGLTAELVHKLFTGSSVLKSESNEREDFKRINRFRLLKNFLFNESFLLSLSGREIIEILESVHASPSESDRMDALDLMDSICQSNLIPIVTESCVELCCVRLSEFKLILLASCIKYFIGDLKEVLLKSITPLILV